MTDPHDQGVAGSPAFSQAVLDALATHIAVLDRGGAIVAVNAAWRRFALANGGDEQPGSTGVGANYLAICRAAADAGDADAAAAAAGISGVLAGAAPSFTLEYPCHAPHEQRWFVLHATPLPEPHGGVVVAHAAVTRRRRAEAALERSQRLLDLFVENAPAAIAMLDRNMTYLAASRRYLTDYRVGLQQIVGRSHYAVFPKIPEHQRAIHQRCLLGASASNEEEAFPHADGSIDWVRWAIHPWYERPGQVGGLIFFSEVITERKRADDALRRSEAQLAGIIDSAMDAIITINAAQQIVRWNAAAAQMFGYPAAEAIGRPIAQFIPERLQSAHYAHIDAFRTTGSTTRTMGAPGILRGQRADGGEFPIEASISRVEADEQLLLTAIVRDITQRVGAEQALRAHAERQEQLRTIAVTLVSLLDSRRISAVIIEQAIAASGAQFGLVVRFQPESPRLELLAAQGFAPEELQQLAALPAYPVGVMGAALRSQAPVRVESAAERDARFPQLKALSPKAPGAAGIAYPLLVDGRLIGCFGLAFEQAHHFTPEELTFLETLAQQCAQALDRALLYDEIQLATRAKDEVFALLDTLFASAPVGLAFLDRELRFVRVNATLAALNEREIGAHIGRRVAEVRPDLAPLVEPHYRAVLASGHPIVNRELSTTTAAGEQHDWLDSYYPVVVPGTAPIGVGVIVVEVTALKRAEAALRASHQQLANLSVRLVSSQEDERRALAYELHDEIGQQLTGLRLALEAGARAPAAQLRAQLRTTQQLAANLLGTVRQLSLNLRPPMLDELGLLPTLLWQVQRFTQQTGVAVDFKHSGLEIPLPPAIAITTYRIVQEGLTNVARHAATTATAVRVWASGGQLKLTIEDQGCGFDPATLPQYERSVGLAGMRQRAELLGGQFNLDSTPGEGTRIRVSLPLADADHPPPT